MLDLRGNGGGSSDWARQIAVILWGQAAVDVADATDTAVDWRVSSGNLATMQAYRDQWRDAADLSAEAKVWSARIADGLADATAKHQSLWREPEDPAPKLNSPTSSASIEKPMAPVFVLTDWGCASACLDAVDLWTTLGATHVGQETSADSLYMDVREIALPSGLAKAIVPMKVYRGRKRGSNMPAIPSVRYRGDMRDTMALADWVTALRRSRGP